MSLTSLPIWHPVYFCFNNNHHPCNQQPWESLKSCHWHCHHPHPSSLPAEVLQPSLSAVPQPHPRFVTTRMFSSRSAQLFAVFTLPDTANFSILPVSPLVRGSPACALQSLNLGPSLPMKPAENSPPPRSFLNQAHSTGITHYFVFLGTLLNKYINCYNYNCNCGSVHNPCDVHQVQDYVADRNQCVGC